MILTEKLDNLHYSFREIDGYNKPINIVISPREPGKTSMFWLNKIYIPFLRDRNPWIYLVRQGVEISEPMLTSILDTILNKFTDDDNKFIYTKNEMRTGIMDIYLINKHIATKTLFFRIVSLNIMMKRIKQAALKKCAGVLMDEFIIDPSTGEKYLQNEYFKIKEAYTTWRREASGVLKMYFLGNPYSLFNPLFVGLGVDTKKMKRDSFYVGDEYVIHWAILSEGLKKKLLELNPFYRFDEDYTKYALEGQAVKDSNIKTGKQPIGFQLYLSIRMGGKYIGIFTDTTYENEFAYFCKFVDKVAADRITYCFEFEEMVERTVIMSLDERSRLMRFKTAMRQGKVLFEDINVYYFILEVYKNI